jgi:hypothetical protein
VLARLDHWTRLIVGIRLGGSCRIEREDSFDESAEGKLTRPGLGTGLQEREKGLQLSLSRSEVARETSDDPRPASKRRRSCE